MEDKRQHARVPCDLAVSWQAAGGAVTGRARDISVGGMFVESTQQPSFNAQLSFSLQLPGLPAASSLPGVVRWLGADGFGVQFGLLGARETHALTNLMRRR